MHTPSLDTPVLLLIFNRPELTKQVFEVIRQARPKHLFVAADGPRPDTPDDDLLCAQARDIAAQVDWPCDFKTLFRDKNLGCRQAVSSAISWFFDHVPEGIILEDDCLPGSSFFDYCEQLLDRYRDDERVMCIAGDNTLLQRPDAEHSYSFSSFALIWGWATWARAWQHYDFDRFAKADFEAVLSSVDRSPGFLKKCADNFHKVANGQLDSWANVWLFSTIAQSGLCCIPKVNLIQNIGFGETATHTFNPEDNRSNISTRALQENLSHPDFVFRDREMDAAYLKHVFGISSSRGSITDKIDFPRLLMKRLRA